MPELHERPGPRGPRRHGGPPWGGGEGGPPWGRGRPPWWPEGEPFPPEGGWGAWGGMRRRFVRRMLVGALGLLFVFLALAITIGSIVAGVTSNDGGGVDHAGAFFPFGVFIAAGLLVVIVFVVRAVRRSAVPVGDVMEAVGRVADGDLSARVAPRGGGDDRRLAHAFNRMAERLETDEARRRELLADLAHELRTPLSVIRGNVEAMLDGLYATDPQHLRRVLDETDVLARLLEDLRTLSMAEAGALVLQLEPVEPRELIEDAVAAFRAQANDRDIQLSASVRGGLPTIEVDHVRIGEVLANLLENALRHTPGGGTVEVAAGPGSVGGRAAVQLSVTDSGPGIPEELLPHVFDRFVRAADSGGSGLGLAIARSLVESHGGKIAAANAGEGGTTMTVTLPAAPG